MISHKSNLKENLIREVFKKKNCAGKEAKTGLLGCVLYRSYGSSEPRRAIGYYHDSSTC